MIKIEVAPEFEAIWPSFQFGAIKCNVTVQPSPSALLAQIAEKCADLMRNLSLEDIHNIPAIAATRDAYKALGKEPSRYRPSAEALIRRVLQGKGLYQVNNVVDLLNLVSISTGFSIGGWDTAHIAGDTITLGIGRSDEPYESIGRGPMNIEFFPVFRDLRGPFGTPTSDSQRTMVVPETQNFLFLIYGFGGKEGISAAILQALELLEEFGGASQFQTQSPI